MPESGLKEAEILTHMVAIGRRGISEQPQKTLVEGMWVGGAI